MRRVSGAMLVAVAVAVFVAGGGAGAEAEVRSAWVWPLVGFTVAEPYRQPAHAYAEGHRGIDLRARQSFDVRAPAGGVVAFVGEVAGRAVVTIDHGDGLVTTLEPAVAVVEPGEVVERAQVVATLAVGGHARPGDLHFGVRRDGEYINPLLLLGGVPRAVLLPCC